MRGVLKIPAMETAFVNVTIGAGRDNFYLFFQLCDFERLNARAWRQRTVAEPALPPDSDVIDGALPGECIHIQHPVNQREGLDVGYA